MGFHVKFKLDGLKEAMESLAVVKKKSTRNKIKRRALNLATTPLYQRTKQLAPKETGLLKKSIGKKSKTYSSGTVVVIIGARKGFAQMVVIGGGKPQKRDPRFYSHLVEAGVQAHAVGKGSSIRKGKQSGRMHPGHAASGFMQNAFAQSRSEMQRTISRVIASEVIREAMRK